MTRDAIRVLLVEDDAVDRRFVQKALDVWDDPVRIDEAPTAADAIDRAGEADHDLVLLDYRLPDADGLSVLKTLRDTVSAPVVVLTAYGSEEVAVQAIKAGAADYLSKDDLTGHRLRLTLRNVLRTHDLAKRIHTIGEEVDYLQDSVAAKERIALIGVLSERSIDGVRSGLDHVQRELTHLQEDVQATADKHPEHRAFLMDVARTLEDDLARPMHELTGLVHTLDTLSVLISSDPRPETVDVDRIVRERIALFEPFAPSDVTVETDLRTGGEARVDPRTIGESMTRLLKNAAEASQDGTVHVRTRRRDGRVVLTVEDDGDGVPDVVGDRAFDLFMTTKPGRAGVGLTLVKHLVQNHDGTVRYEEREQGGTRFEVTIPEIPRE